LKILHVYFKGVDTIRRLINKLDTSNNIKFVAAKGLKYLAERFKQRAKKEINEMKLESYGMNFIAFRYKLNMY
jgi:hypothetical protein